MKSKFTLLIVAILFLMQNISFGQSPPPLGTTASFAIFTSVGAVNNDGATVIRGDVGTMVGPLTGLRDGPGVVIGNFEVITPLSVTAAADVGVAYGFLAAMTPLDVIGVGLGNDQVLGPGVHSIGGVATLNGTLTLDGLNNPNSLFVFKINGALSTTANSKVVLINSANVCNVYWQINGQFDLATYSAFQGTVIAAGPINLFEYSTLLGRGLSTSGAINLHNTQVTLPPCACSVTPPIVGAVTQRDCYVATGSVVLSGLPAEGTWTLNPGTITGTGTSTTLSGLASGTYNFTVTDAAGCTSAPSGDVVINPYTLPTPYEAPTVGTITQPTCLVPTGNVVLGGLPSTGTWYIHPTDNPSLIVSTGTGTSTTIYGLGAGTHNYTVTGQDVCWNYSAPSAPVVITASGATPTVTFTQPTNCTSHAGTITVTGLTGDCWKYSIDGSTYNTTGIFTEVPAGTYTVTAISSDGCITTGTNVTINTYPRYATPIVGTITQPDCLGAGGSVVLSGLPATGTWYLNPGGIAGTGTSTTLSGLAAGTYNFTVTSPEVCWSYSSPSANVVINATVAAPTVTLTQPTTCTLPTGSITVTAPLGAGMTYSINGSDYSNTTGAFTSLSPGTYLVTAKNGALCISSGTSVTINTVPVTLASATSQTTCVVTTGTITVTGPPAGSGMTYSINGTDYTNNTGVFPLLPPGIYPVTSRSADLCTSSVTFVTINAPGALAAPTVALIQPTTCTTPTGTITVTAPTGAGMKYSINGTDYTNTNGMFTVAAGSYIVTAMSADGCLSLGKSVTINAQPVTLAAATAQPTCTVANGTITVTAPTGAGTTYSINGTDYTNTTGVFTVPAGTYTVTSKLVDCISSGASVTINAQPALLAAPAFTVTQPTGSETTGTVTVTTLPGYCITYSVNGLPYTFTTSYTLPIGTYNLTAREWAGGCISPETPVTISIATAIEIIGADSKFDIYPVPNDGHFTVLMNSLTEKHFDIVINNAQGSKIYEEKNIIVNGKLEHRIDLAQVKEGMYYVTIRSGNDKVIRKIVISK